MAVFGAPVAQEKHTRRALLAALELHPRPHVHPALHEPRPGGDHAVQMGLHSALLDDAYRLPGQLEPSLVDRQT